MLVYVRDDLLTRMCACAWERGWGCARPSGTEGGVPVLTEVPACGRAPW